MSLQIIVCRLMAKQVHLINFKWNYNTIKCKNWRAVNIFWTHWTISDSFILWLLFALFTLPCSLSLSLSFTRLAVRHHVRRFILKLMLVYDDVECIWVSVWHTRKKFLTKSILTPLTQHCELLLQLLNNHILTKHIFKKSYCCKFKWWESKRA